MMLVQQPSSWTGNASSPLQQRSHRKQKQPLILRQNAHIQDTGQVTKRTVHTESHGYKKHQTPSSVPAVSELVLSIIDCSLGLTVLSHSDLLKLDRLQNKARKVILGVMEDTPIEAIQDLLDLPPNQTRHIVEKVKVFSVQCRIPRIHSMLLSKKKRYNNSNNNNNNNNNNDNNDNNNNNNNNNNNDNNICIERRNSFFFFFYNLLTALETVSNTYAQVTRA